MEVETLTYSKDIQTVTVKLALNHHVKPEIVGNLWSGVGKDFQARLIDPSIQESVKSATAKFTAQELIEQRPLVKEEIKKELLIRMNNYFVVDEFSIIDFSFSDAYEKAIESKQVAQQKALEQENISKQVEEQAKQRVTTATAEAQAIKIQAEAVTQQGGADYVKLKAIEKWNGSVPTTMVPGSTVPFLDLNK
jgi:regulator of protease activity HflC (stomatin/prohibitin superfamily)